MNLSVSRIGRRMRSRAVPRWALILAAFAVALPPQVCWGAYEAVANLDASAEIAFAKKTWVNWSLAAKRWIAPLRNDPAPPNGPGSPYSWSGSAPVPHGLVNMQNGNLFLTFPITGWSGVGPDVGFALFYNSQDTESTTLGPGWRHSLSAEVEYDDPDATVVEPDGRRHTFVDDDGFVPPPGIDDQLVQNPAQGEPPIGEPEDWVLTRKDKTAWVYRASDNQLSSIEDLRGYKINLAYNQSGLLGLASDAADRQLVFTYSNNKLVAVEDPLGREWTFDYDQNGRLKEIVYPDLKILPSGSTEATGKKYEFTYVASGGNAGKLESIVERQGEVIEFTYDGSGELSGYEVDGSSLQGNPSTCTCCKGGLFTPLSFYGRIKTWKVGNGSGNEISITFQFDDADRLTSVLDGEDRETLLVWTSDSRLEYVISPTGQTWIYGYDEAGNVDQIIDPAFEATTIKWTDLNRIEWIDDPMTPANWRRVEYEYNEYGEPIEKRALAGPANDPRYAVTTYDWHEGLLLEVIDPNENPTAAFTYDGYGQLETIADALSHTTTFERNAVGWTTKRTDAKSVEIAYAYDSWGRLRAKECEAEGLEVAYSYNFNDQMTQMTDATGTTEWTYDEDSGQLLSEESPAGLVEYEYGNGNGLLYWMRIAAGEDVYALKYDYNEAGQLASAYKCDSGACTYTGGAWSLLADPTYDSYGRLVHQAFGNGTSVEYDYPGQGYSDEPNAIVWKTPTPSEYKRQVYSRDALRRITGIAEHLNGSQTPDWEVEYEYDLMGQLVEEVRTGSGAFSAVYDYDDAGNRLSREKTVGQTTIEDELLYDAANRVESVNEEGWTHDENGNVTERAYDGQTWTLTYDAEDRVIRIEEKGESLGVSFEYDGLGRKVRSVDEIAEIETDYIYSGSTLVAEVRDGTFIPIGYGLGMAERNGAYQHWNLRGDLMATSNGSGTYSTAPVFDAYGASVSGVRADYDFGGAWLYRNVSNTGGLTHIGARWYDPETGRWLQKDSAFDGWNLYLYCASDPVNLVDPEGTRRYAPVGLGGLAAGAGFVLTWTIWEVYQGYKTYCQARDMRDRMVGEKKRYNTNAGRESNNWFNMRPDDKSKIGDGNRPEGGLARDRSGKSLWDDVNHPAIEY